VGHGNAQQTQLNAGLENPTLNSRDTTPSVLAVIVAHTPGDWFDETLASFANQDYPRLETLVVDAAGDPSLATRVQARLPRASVLDASDTNGFSGAANAILDTALDPLFLLICHDDVALETDAVRLLVLESLRSNAGIVGPKLLYWDNPDRLQHVAYVVDRLAAASDVVEPKEIDQEQYDGVVDVFAVPSAAVLIRSDLFRRLEGFDPEMPFHGEDVDLCFRAQLAGARVMAVPDARVRHREALADRTKADSAVVERLRARHQLRTVMVTSSYPSLGFLLPLALLFSVGESFAALAKRQFAQFRNIWAAWTWNLRHLDEIRSRRTALRALRRVRYRDVRAQQHRRSVRLGATMRGQGGADAGFVARHELTAKIQTGTVRIAAVVWGLLALFVVFGSRSLISGGVPVVGDYLPFADSGSEMLGDWWSGWRERDLGSTGSAASAAGLLGFLAVVSGGALGLVRTLWVLAPVAVGLLGAWRMLRATASRRAQLGSVFVYAMLPLPWAVIASASISGIYAYALAPWLLGGLLKAQGAAAPWRVKKSWFRQVSAGVGIGVALGAAAAFDVSTALIVVPMLAGLLLAGLLTFSFNGTLRLLSSVLMALPVALLLVLPFVVDLLVAGTKANLAPFVGGRDGSASALGLVDIFRFDVGPAEPGHFVWAFALLMAVPLAIGRSWRFAMAVRGWSVALVSWGLAWVVALGWLPFGMPDNGVILAPAAAAVALTCGLAVVAFEHDLAAVSFGWRQALMPLAVLAALIGALPGLALAETGRWEMPRSDYADVLPFANPREDGSYRVLWIGNSETLLGDGRHLVADVAWLASLDGPPKLADAKPAVDPGAALLVQETLLRALDGTTIRVGRQLGGLGIRYVVLLDRLAPAPFSEPDATTAIDEGIKDAFAAQLDLRHLEGINSAVEVYVNTAWTAVRAAATPGFDQAITEISDLAVAPIVGSAGVMAGRGSKISGEIPAETDVLVAQSADPLWRFELDGRRVTPRPVLGYATAFSAQTGGLGDLVYSTQPWRRLLLVGQVLALVLLLAVLVIRPVVGHQR